MGAGRGGKLEVRRKPSGGKPRQERAGKPKVSWLDLWGCLQPIDAGSRVGVGAWGITTLSPEIDNAIQDSKV